jgi:two-component system, NarL family, sensor kinase
MIKQIYFLAFAGIFLFFVMSFFIVFVFMHNRGKQRQSEQDKEKMRSDFAQELLKAQLEIQEQAFRTISQEIHDNIGQLLSIAKMNLGTVNYSKEKELRLKIDDSKELVGQAIRDLRDISYTLHPEAVIGKGLQGSVEYELEVLIRTGSFEVIYTLEGTATRFPANEELILFRIFQEALNNAIRHGGGNILEVLLNYAPEEFSMSVKDNGQGFTPGVTPEKGLGLRSMRNRAELIGATVTIDACPGKGCTVLVKRPQN